MRTNSEMTTGDLKPMARRKKSRTPRRRFTGLAVLPALEAYVQTSIWTEAALGVNPVQFFTGITEKGFRPGTDGGQRITLPELLGAGVGIGFNLVKKMTRKARSGLNRQILKPLGVSSMIKL